MKVCEVGVKMGDCLNRDRKPYWCHCIEVVQQAIIEQMTVYDKKKIPEQLRFKVIRNSMIDVYELYKDDVFNKDFILIVDGVRKPNDGWIKISSTSDMEDYSEDASDDIKVSPATMGNLYNVKRENRGISIKIANRETEETKDYQFPFSEMYETACYLRSNGYNTVNYPATVIYLVLSLIKFSIPTMNKNIEKTLRDMKPAVTRNITGGYGVGNKKMEKIMESNAGIFENLSNTLISSLDGLDEEEMLLSSRRVVGSIYKHGFTLDAFKKLQGENASEEDKEDMKKMEKFMTGGSIQTMINKTTEGVNMKDYTSEELIASVPRGNVTGAGIDEYELKN